MPPTLARNNPGEIGKFPLDNAVWSLYNKGTLKVLERKERAMITKLMTNDLTESEFFISEVMPDFDNDVTIWRVFYIPVGREHPSYQTWVDVSSRKRAIDTLAEQWEQYEDWYRWATPELEPEDQEYRLSNMSWFFRVEKIAVIANIYKQ